MPKKIISFLKQQKSLEIFFLILISLTPLLWLRDGSVIIGHDTGFYLNPVDRWKAYLYAWLPRDGFGMDYSLYRGFLITLAPHGLFGFLTGSLAWAQRLTFIFWFFVMGICMYTFANYLLPKKRDWPFRLIASTYYVYNFFILQAWFIAERAKFSLYAALPLLLLVLFKTQRKQLGLARGAIYFGLILFFLNGGGSPPLYGFIILTLLVYFAFYLFKSLLNKDFAIILRTVKMYFLFGISSLFLNFYWVWPLFNYYKTSYGAELATRGGISNQIDWFLTVSKNTTYFNLIRMQGIPSWFDSLKHPYANAFINSPLLIAISLIPILTIFLGLVSSRFLTKIRSQVREALAFAFLLFIAGLVFSAGGQPPFGKIYILFLKYIPGFAMFRNAFYKFAPALWFPMILMFAYFVNYLITNLKIKKYIGVFLILGILVFHYPYFSPTLFNLDDQFSTHLQIPEYVYQMSDYVINNLSEDERILLLPPIDSNTGVDTYNWGFYSLDNLPKSALGGVSVVANRGPGSNLVNGLYRAIGEGDSRLTQEYLELLRIDKVLWRGDAIHTYIPKTTSDFLSMLEMLSRFEYAQPEVKYGAWQLFDLKLKADKNYITDNIVQTNADVDFVFQNENFDKTPAIIDLSVTDIDNSALLVRPECSGCDFNKGIQKSEFLFIPPIEHKPGTWQYKISRFLERRRLQKAPSPSAKVDNLLISIARRVGEMRDFGQSEQLISDYESSIGEIKSNFENLSEKQKIFYSQRITEYLNYLSLFYPPASKESDYFEKYIWDTGTYEKVKMLVDIPISQDYEIRNQQDMSIKIDDTLTGKSTINLTSGLHKIVVERERPANLIDGNLSSEVYSDESEYQYDLPELNLGDSYLITFRYRLNSSDPVWMLVKNGARYEEMKLENSEEWVELSHLFSVVDDAQILYYTKTGTGFDLELKDIYLSGFELPQLYFYYQNNLGKARYNSVFVMGEAYSPGWQLRGLNGRHIKANGFANGWILDEEVEESDIGKYETYYKPQNNYKLGQAVSLCAFIFGGAFLILPRYWKRRSGV